MSQLDNDYANMEQLLQNQTLKGKQLRLILALEYLKLQESEDAELFNNWLKEEAALQPDTIDDEVELMVSLSHVLNSLAFYQSGPADDYIEKTLKFIAEIGDDKEEFEFLKKMGELLDPAKVGYWLQLVSDHVEAGWYFPCELALGDVMDSIAPSEDKYKFLQWAEANDTAYCLQIRRSIGKPLPMTELLIELTEEDTDQYFTAAKSFFEVLGITWFGTALEETLKELGVGEIGLVAGFNQEGICRLGILIYHREDELTLTLGNLSEDFSYEDLARFEGLLLSEGPDFITFSQEGEGQKTDFYYLL